MDTLVLGAENIVWKHPPLTVHHQVDTVHIECAPLQTDHIDAIASKFGTTWFRLLSALIGLTIKKHVVSKTAHLHVAFSGRPTAFTSTCGHFANLVPVPIPQPWKNSTAPMLGNFINTVTSLISDASEASLHPYLELCQHMMKTQPEMLRPQVVVTHAPRIATAKSKLYPIQTGSDLYFCLQDDASGCQVHLSVSVHSSMWSVCRRNSSFLNTYKDLLQPQRSDGKICETHANTLV